MSKFDENYKLTDSRRSKNFKQKEHEGNLTRHIIIKLLNTVDKEKKKIIKAARGKNIYIQEKR